MNGSHDDSSEVQNWDGQANDADKEWGDQYDDPIEGIEACRENLKGIERAYRPNLYRILGDAYGSAL